MSAAKTTGGTNPPPQAEPEYVPPPLPPGIRAALRVFVARLPELLKKHEGKWVACDGEGVRAVGDSWDVVYDRCLKDLSPDEFVVDFVTPGAFADLDLESLNDPR
jgi:hypothetical protein